MPPITVLANWLLRLPLLWGGLATLGFYACLQSGPINSPLLTRYFASHPVEWVATLLFFIGMAALGLRLSNLLGQLGAVKLQPLGPIQPGGQPASDAESLLAKLSGLSAPLRRTTLVRRLRDALEYVRDTGSADTLEEQLDRLVVIDRDHVSTGYALPRLVRATLPIIGMIGTVIGITLAVGELSTEDMEASIGAVTGALSVAFDTTAQAMSLMLVLWFAMFTVERVEERLLDEVDLATGRALVGRFQVYGSQNDPNVAAVRRMSEQVVESVDKLSANQQETLQSLLGDMQRKWQTTTESTGELLTSTLTAGLRDGLRDHATGLNTGVETQLASLNASLNDQQAHVASAVREQLASLEKLQTEYAERLQTTTDQQTSRIVSGADGVLGNLRDGLERMAELLVEALQKHGETLTTAEHELASENRRHLGEVEAALGEAMVVSADRQEKLVRQSESVLREMQQALVSAAGATIDHQNELVKQGEILLKVVDSTGQVQRLEDSLNRNLDTLGRTHKLDETLMSLSAAIQLLSARTGREMDAPVALSNKAA
ncbi:MotA/TolQ/ExbB proton channel family protein [Planctomycetes bacterium MalM25]|nr:MotA/TolQ/ExbB proton channel family protein [Planctomycetes bacterium MalM25]